MRNSFVHGTLPHKTADWYRAKLACEMFIFCANTSGTVWVMPILNPSEFCEVFADNETDL